MTGLHSLSLGSLGQVSVVFLTSLHVFSPGVRQDLRVQNLNVLVKTLSLLLELFLLGLLLGLSQLALLDGTVRDQVLTLKLRHDFVVRLLLGQQDGACVVLCVHRALETIDKTQQG